MNSPARSSSLLFMRHGVTALNAAGLRCGGDIDLPLIDLGHRQSVQAAQRLATMRPRVGVIVVSALQRARQTADIVGQAMRDVDIVVEPAFNERHLGAWNRRPIAETQAELEAGITPPGGESNAEFTRRVHDAVVGTLMPLLGERPLLVASKGVARVLGEITGLSPREPLDNAGIVEFDLSGFVRCNHQVCAA